MSPLLILGLVVAGTVAMPGYSGDGSGYRPEPPGYGPFFSHRELENLENFIHAVASEKIALGEKIKALKDNQSDLLLKLQDIIFDKLGGVQADQVAQNDRIRDIVDRINALLISGGNLEGRANRELTIARRQADVLDELSDRTDNLLNAQTRQNASLARAESALVAAKDQVTAKIETASSFLEDSVNEVSSSIEALRDLTNTRHCIVRFAEVYIGDDGTGQSVADIPDAIFTGEDEPTVFCAIQGLENKLKHDKTKRNPGYGGYGGYYGAAPNAYGYGVEDERQTLAASVTCQGFNDRVVVNAVDQSLGEGNAVTRLYISIKACSFSARAGFLH